MDSGPGIHLHRRPRERRQFPWKLGVSRRNTFGNLWSGLFIAAGTVTLVFAILERTSAHLGAECKWDPLKLPPVRKEGRKPSLMKAVCEFGFGFFGLVWLLLVPYYPVLILGPAAAFLKASPMVHTFYLPILLLSAFGLLRSESPWLGRNGHGSHS